MFSSLIGNDDVKELLRRLLAAKRLPGSMLFTGEIGIGKKLFALEVAKALNCRNPQEIEACDECSSCRRISHSTFPPFGKDDDDKDRLIWSEHGDVAMARPYKQIIRVLPMRELEREANFRPFEGAARVFIVEDAEYMNDSSSNALLKILEEPPSTAHLILTTSNPTALLATIRSRCQVVRFAPISYEAIEQFLTTKEALSTTDAKLLARASGGSLGRALSLDIESYREVRESMLEIITSLVLTGDRARLLRSAEGLAAVKDRESYEQRLDVLETLIRDAWALALGRPEEGILNYDLLKTLREVAAQLKSTQAAAWLSEIEELRAALEVNINRKIASDALVMRMMIARA